MVSELTLGLRFWTTHPHRAAKPEDLRPLGELEAQREYLARTRIRILHQRECERVRLDSGV